MIYRVASFTEEPTRGNPAGVCLVDEFPSDEKMLGIAQEVNYSETAFVKQVGDHRYEIRWFSPIKEIPFCGHAMLASAFTLANSYGVAGAITFVSSEMGEMRAQIIDAQTVTLDVPNLAPSAIDEAPNELILGLGHSPKKVLLNSQAYVAIFDSAEQVSAIKPNAEALKKLAPHDVVVSAPSDEFDFVSRYFWPASGGLEDPVTGSIHAALAPYWGAVLAKQQLRAYQASERGGMIDCQLIGDRVAITGKACFIDEKKG